jgi:hypothetical protein
MSDNKLGKLFICEKPAQLQSILKTLGSPKDRAIIAPVITSYKFDYPKHIPFNKITFLGNPNYKMSLNMRDMIFHVYKHDSSEENGILKNRYNKLAHDLNFMANIRGELNDESYSSNPTDFFKDFEEVIYACSPNYSTIRTFDFHLKYFFNMNECFFNNNNIKYTYLKYRALDKISLQIAFLDRQEMVNEKIYASNGSEIYLPNLFDSGRESYRKKDYFEYNYNVNSIVLLNEILRVNGLITPSHVITKNTVSTLLLIHNNTKQLTEERLLSAMLKLKIGSNWSVAKIIKNMFQDNLIGYKKEYIDGIQKEYIILTELGLKFISSINNKLKFKHLSVNLDKDILNVDFSFDNFKEKYSILLRKMFDKQKRLNRRLYSISSD